MFILKLSGIQNHFMKPSDSFKPLSYVFLATFLKKLSRKRQTCQYGIFTINNLKNHEYYLFKALLKVIGIWDIFFLGIYLYLFSITGSFLNKEK